MSERENGGTIPYNLLFENYMYKADKYLNNPHLADSLKKRYRSAIKKGGEIEQMLKILYKVTPEDKVKEIHQNQLATLAEKKSKVNNMLNLFIVSYLSEVGKE